MRRLCFVAAVRHFRHETYVISRHFRRPAICRRATFFLLRTCAS